MPDSKYFGVPFGASGDRAAIPEATQPGGSISYQQGFGPDYERNPANDPLAKRVPRDETNEYLYQITNALKFLQLYGLPEWYATDGSGNAVSYPLVARVRHNGEAWVSIVANNTAQPGTDATKWALDVPFTVGAWEATDAEAIAGVIGTKLITPRRLAAVTSTDARRGLVELATPAEVLAGTDTQRAVTPFGVAQLPKGVPANRVAYTTPGTFSWTCPANVFRVNATLWAGGGSGGGTSAAAGSFSSAGGAGGYATGTYAVTPSSVYGVIVGAGGASVGTFQTSDGQNGGSSSFGAFISATGGGRGFGANGGPQFSMATAGEGSGGNYNRSGQRGGISFPLGGDYRGHGQGGAAWMGTPSGLIAANGTLAGAPGWGPGGGGGGCSMGGASGAGQPGLVILEF